MTEETKINAENPLGKKLVIESPKEVLTTSLSSSAFNDVEKTSSDNADSEKRYQCAFCGFQFDKFEKSVNDLFLPVSLCPGCKHELDDPEVQNA